MIINILICIGFLSKSNKKRVQFINIRVQVLIFLNRIKQLTIIFTQFQFCIRLKGILTLINIIDHFSFFEIPYSIGYKLVCFKFTIQIAFPRKPRVQKSNFHKIIISKIVKIHRIVYHRATKLSIYLYIIVISSFLVVLLGIIRTQRAIKALSTVVQKLICLFNMIYNLFFHFRSLEVLNYIGYLITIRRIGQFLLIFHHFFCLFFYFFKQIKYLRISGQKISIKIEQSISLFMYYPFIVNF